MPDWLLPLLDSHLVGGVASGIVSGLLFLGGIKVELRNLHEKTKDAKDLAAHAHRRIDDHIEHFHTRAPR